MKSHLLSSHAVKRQPRNFNQNKRFVFAHMPIPNEHITHTHTHTHTQGWLFSVRFGFYQKKKTKPKIKKKKKNWNRTKTGSNRLVSVRFFRTKTGSNLFGSVFSGFARFFSGLGSVRFFRFGSGWLGFFSVSVRFGFWLMKPNRAGRFFQNFKRFFFTIRFFRLFFFRFSRFFCSHTHTHLRKKNTS